MKKILAGLIFAVAIGLGAQSTVPSNRYPSINIVTLQPSGGCQVPSSLEQYNGDIYTCDPTTGTWRLLTGSGGNGTVTGQASGIVPLGTNATTIGSQSHLDDGKTTTGTITSTEPIIASASQGVIYGPAYSTPAAAVAAACASPSLSVYFPSGTYPQSATMNVCQGLHISCAANGVVNSGGTIFQMQSGFAGWGLANPNADSSSPGAGVYGLVVDNCQWDMSGDSAALGAIRHKGMSSAHYNHIGIFTNDNGVPAITLDGSNETNNSGNYDTVFLNPQLYDNSHNSRSTSIGMYFTGSYPGEIYGGANNIVVLGGAIQRFGTSVYMDGADNDTFKGVDLEDFRFGCIVFGTNSSSSPAGTAALNNFDVDSRCEAGSVTGGPAWAATTAYTIGQTITDSSGNIEVATTNGTTGGTVPTWPAAASVTSPSTPEALTVDGTETWKMEYYRTGIMMDANSRDNNMGATMLGAFRYTLDNSGGRNSFPVPTEVGDLGVTPTTARNAAFFSNDNESTTIGVNVGPSVFFPDINISSAIGGEIIHGALGVDREIGLCGGNKNESFLAGTCSNYTVLSSNNASGVSQIVFPDTGGQTATVLTNVGNLTLSPTQQATVPSTNHTSNQEIIQNSWYDGRLVFAQYNSGGTVVGTNGQTCTASSFNNGVSGAQFTFTIGTTPNQIPVDQEGALVAGGTGGSSASTPTTATLSSGTATCSGTINVTTLVGAGTGQFLIENAPGGGSNPAQTLVIEPNGTTGMSEYFFEFGNNGATTTGSNMTLFNVANAINGTDQAPPALDLLGACWTGSASGHYYWDITPDLTGALNIAPTISAGCSESGIVKLPAGTTVGGNVVGVTPARGTATLVSGTVTVSNSAACAVGSSCVYKITNCGPNSSTGIGTLSLGTVSAGTSFVINSLSPTNTVLTTDLSTVCWQIN